MKRLVVFLLCMLLMLTTAACSKEPVQDPASTTSTTSASSSSTDMADDTTTTVGSETANATTTVGGNGSTTSKTTAGKTTVKNPAGVRNPYDTKATGDPAGAWATMKSPQTDSAATNMKKQINNAKSSYNIKGMTIYISNTGNDDNKGTSPDQAWASIDKLNTIALSPGDAVLFERGGIYRSSDYCVNTQEGVTYGAYGTGDKPCIYGAAENAVSLKWAKHSGNIWVCEKKYTYDAGVIVFNHGEAIGDKKMWDLDELEEDYDFFHNPKDGKIYLYMSKGDPSKLFKDMEIPVYKHIMVLRSDMVIDNLCLKYGGAHAVSGVIGLKNAKVTNCEIGWIGGSRTEFTASEANIRYGNGIQFWGLTENCLVENNYVYQIYDSAITPQFQGSHKDLMGFKDITIRNNLVEYCTTSYEYFLNQNGTSDGKFDNVLVEGNLFRFSGYGWGTDARVNASTAMVAYGIGGLTGHNNAVNYVFRNNTIDRSRGCILDCRVQNKESFPMMSGNTYIQTKGGQFGCWVVKSTDINPKMMYADDTLADTLKNKGIEINATVTLVD